jgi:hypothetical protein
VPVTTPCPDIVRVATTRVVVVSFLPEFVYSLGSPSHDYAFLLPFYSKVERRPHVVRASEDVVPEAHGALARLLEFEDVCHHMLVGIPPIAFAHGKHEVELARGFANGFETPRMHRTDVPRRP